MKKIWYLYMVRCANDSLYTGISIDVEARVILHNQKKGSKAVIALGLPVKLVYIERVGKYSEALKREIEVRSY